ELNRVLSDLVGRARGPSTTGPLYLPVQRAFAAEGFGTVITGVPVRGEVRVGDIVEISPAGRTVRVRGIEAYGNRLEHARAGHRTALNLAEVGHRELQRGDVLGTPGYFQGWPTAVARLKILASRRLPFKQQTSVRFHVGTSESTGRAFLLEKKALGPGEEGWVQFRLDTPVVVTPGDRFIIRGISPMVTLGGGVVIQGKDRKLKTGRSWVIDEVRRGEDLTRGPRPAVLEVLRRSALEPLQLPDIARRAVLRPEEAEAVVEALAGEGRIRSLGTGDRVILEEAFQGLLEKTEEALAAFHAREPLAEGMPRVALRDALGANKMTMEPALKALEEGGRIGTRHGLIFRAGFSVTLTAEDEEALQALEGLFREARFKPPTPGEALSSLSMEDRSRLYLLLVQRGALVELPGEGLTFHRDVLEEARAMIVEEIQAKGELVAAEFRDRLGTTRKYIIPLLEHFDKIGLTIRVENRRFLREHVRGRGQDPGP
ncbi:MAG: SelB domain-containing protein, partial [Planctomycetota bacterium]